MSATLINHGNPARNAITAPQLNESKLKDKIIAEILNVYPDLPNEFYGHNLYSKVCANVYKHELHFPYYDTVGRYFRQLREDGIIKCECISKSKSIYKKQP